MNWLKYLCEEREGVWWEKMIGRIEMNMNREKERGMMRHW